MSKTKEELAEAHYWAHQEIHPVSEEASWLKSVVMACFIDGYDAGAASRDGEVREYRRALERISKIRDYTQSQSTGTKYYHMTEGAEVALAALAKYPSESDTGGE